MALFSRITRRRLVEHPYILPFLLVFVIAWMIIFYIIFYIIDYQLIENLPERDVIIMVEDDEALYRKRNPYPCHALGTCEQLNYIRDGRLSRPGQLGASRTSWGIPHLWKNDGGVKYELGCYRQVHVWANGGRVRNISCPELPCAMRLVQDTSYATMQGSDAVILRQSTDWDWDEMYANRPRHQKWVFYSAESPLNTRPGVIPPPERYSDTYDYIMTYRRDKSQLYASYGTYDTSAPSAGVFEGKNWAEGKTRKVVWLASHCFESVGLHWQRYQFVSILSKHIHVNIYGKCGDSSVCAPFRNADLCTNNLRSHKFYLALENSPCKDYITEKLWNNAYLNDLVPVVFGLSRADYEAVAPPNSFIHVSDFASVKELAQYLHELDQNDELYNKYFEWKKHGFVVATKEAWLFEPRQMCQVLDRLLVDEEAVAKGTFEPMQAPDWSTWWVGSCDRTSLPIDAG